MNVVQDSISYVTPFSISKHIPIRNSCFHSKIFHFPFTSRTMHILISPLPQADLVILGSRGLGSFKRSLMGFAGLGSVSDFAVHNCHCAVAVIKAAVEKLPEAAPEIAAVKGTEGPKNVTEVVTAPAPAGVGGEGTSGAAKED
jgi:hypothetical protein